MGFQLPDHHAWKEAFPYRFYECHLDIEQYEGQSTSKRPQEESDIVADATRLKFAFQPFRIPFSLVTSVSIKS